jgi:hypothetical protein
MRMTSDDCGLTRLRHQKLCCLSPGCETDSLSQNCVNGHEIDYVQEPRNSKLPPRLAAATHLYHWHLSRKTRFASVQGPALAFLDCGLLRSSLFRSMYVSISFCKAFVGRQPMTEPLRGSRLCVKGHAGKDGRYPGDRR